MRAGKKPEWMSTQEVSEYLGVNLHTLRGWIKRGVIDADKSGRKLRFKRDYVAAFKRGDPAWFPSSNPLYSPQGLSHYRNSPEKYEMTQEGNVYWIKLRADYLQGLSPEDRAREYFDPLRYLMTKMPRTGEAAILINQLDFKRLPPAEQDHWLQYKFS